ncbi:MAG TPA: MFS transporter [Ilumatobacteraceae bacterium]|nr:MFS transporter [Ilumatobacteraceae bacterium]
MTTQPRPEAGRRALQVGLVAVVTLVAFESLAVITILPDIEADLGGIAWYGWVTTAFFLGTMIGIVFAGDQADRRGAGRPYVVGLVLFAAGLVIGGLAPAMPVLVVGRFVQGFGAGVVPAIGYVAIGRAFAEAERPRMFAILSTAWVVPGLVGPVLAERVSDVFGWRWVFLGLVPLVAVAGAMVVPAMRRIGPVGSDAQDDRGPWLRRRMVEAARVAAGAALVVASFTASRWLLVPGVVGGLLVGLGPLSRLTPPGTLRARPGLPSVILSRGLLTFAFFGADTFVPYALHSGRGASVFAGSVAVTMATLSWTVGTWIQDRWIGRTGEAHFVRLAYAVLLPAIVVVALGAMPDLLPFWVIPVGWAFGGLGIGLGYAAHSQLTLRCAPADAYGAATASLQLLDNLGVALGTGAAGVIVTLGDDVGWPPGDAAAVAFGVTAAVAAVGLVVSRRLPAPSPGATAPLTPAVASD